MSCERGILRWIIEIGECGSTSFVEHLSVVSSWMYGLTKQPSNGFDSSPRKFKGVAGGNSFYSI